MVSDLVVVVGDDDTVPSALEHKPDKHTHSHKHIIRVR